MEDGISALLFFYGLFWAEILATTARYRGFPTVTLWARWNHIQERSRRLRRMGMSILLLNLVPIAWLGILYYFVVPKESGVFPVCIAALASLSIFGIIRLYHGFVASSETMNKYYTPEELERLKIHGDDEAHPRWAHLGPGILYLVCYPLLAFAVRGLHAL